MITNDYSGVSAEKAKETNAEMIVPHFYSLVNRSSAAAINIRHLKSRRHAFLQVIFSIITHSAEIKQLAFSENNLP